MENVRNIASSYGKTSYGKSNPHEIDVKFEYSSYGPKCNQKINTTVNA